MAAFTNANTPTIGGPLAPPPSAPENTTNGALDTYLDMLGGNTPLATFQSTFGQDDEAANIAADWSSGAQVTSTAAAINPSDKVIYDFLTGSSHPGAFEALQNTIYRIKPEDSVTTLKTNIESYLNANAANENADIAVLNHLRGFLGWLNQLPKDWDGKPLNFIRAAYETALTGQTQAQEATSNNATTAASAAEAYNAVLAAGRANEAGWDARAIEVYDQWIHNPGLTDAQRAALTALRNAALQFQEDNADINLANESADAVASALTTSAAAGQAAIDTYLESAAIANARASGDAVTLINSGQMSFDGTLDLNADLSVGREAGQLEGFRIKLAEAQQNFETTFLQAAADNQNAALQSVGIELSDDINEQKANVMTWLTDLENTIKAADLEASAETAAVLRELETQKIKLEGEQLNMQTILRIVVAVVSAAAVVAGTVVSIASAGTLAPLGAGLVAAGVSGVGVAASGG